MALVQPIKLGGVNCFLLRNGDMVLVDTGIPGQHKNFLRQMRELELDPRNVQLIIITHGHGDHFGSALKIKELTGARVAVHRNDAAIVKEGKKIFPPGLTIWGCFLAFIMWPLSFLIHYPGIEPDIILEDEFSLADFGINGRVIHTPGHTAGSVSVVLKGGEAMVGDLAMNGFPMRRGAGLPIFGDSELEIRQSWRHVLDAGARIVYPSHGAPFPAGQLE